MIDCLHLGQDLYVHLKNFSISGIGTIGEINSINFSGGPAGLYDMFMRQKTKAPFPQLNIIMARFIAKSGAEHVTLLINI